MRTFRTRSTLPHFAPLFRCTLSSPQLFALSRRHAGQRGGEKTSPAMRIAAAGAADSPTFCPLQGFGVPRLAGFSARAASKPPRRRCGPACMACDSLTAAPAARPTASRSTATAALRHIGQRGPAAAVRAGFRPRASPCRDPRLHLHRGRPGCPRTL
jgi:hypothetical protein